MVPMLLFGLLLAAAGTLPALVSALPANSSQKSFFSFGGPFGGAPKLSQNSAFSGLALLFGCERSSPSTNLLKDSDAYFGAWLRLEVICVRPREA